MRRLRAIRLLCVLPLVSAACFHQVIRTGRAPGTTVVERAFVATWLWGLVPARPIDVRQACPGGVAIIETQQSFANGLVSLLTLGLYAPQQVKVTCASSSASLPRGLSEIAIPATAAPAEQLELIGQAIHRAAERGAPTILRF